MKKEKGERTLRGIYPDGALPLFIGGGDRLGGEGVQSTSNMKFLLNEDVQTVKKQFKKSHL